jgi:hypothetical protein
MHSLRYNPLQNGRPDGWIIQNLSFLFPYHLAADSARIHVDELHLFREERSRELDIGLFLPDGGESPDAMVSDVIQSVFDLNLRRVEDYRVKSGLEAAHREEAYRAAAAEGLDFFLRPVYELRGDELTLELEVCNTSTRNVSNTVRDRTVVGMNIFDDLDEISEEAVNIIADTNLTFAEKMEKSAETETKVWRDELDTLEEYWIPFDRVTVEPAESSQDGGIVLSPGDRNDAQWRREAEKSPDVLKAGMILTEPYFEGIEEISFQVKLPDAAPGGSNAPENEREPDERAAREGRGAPSALLLWNYRARDSYNSLRLGKDSAVIRLSGYESVFDVPVDSWNENGWSDVRIRREETGAYSLFLGDRKIGNFYGPDLAFGRLGFGVKGNPASFRNVEVRFSE